MILGLDVGNGSIGLCVRDGDQTITDVFTSVYGRVDHLWNSNADTDVDVFSINNEHFVIGYDNVLATRGTPIGAYDRENRFENSQFKTLANLALLDAATRTGKTGVIEVTLGFGTSSEDFTNQIKDAVKKWFSTPLKGAKNSQQVIVIVKEVYVISQPIATLLNFYFLDDDGKKIDKALEHEAVLVLDAGSGTLDISEISNMELVKQSSEPIGMNDVYQMVMEEIKRREPKVRINAYDLEYQIRKQLKSGSDEIFYRYGSLTVSITEVYNRAREIVWERLVGSVEWKYPDRLHFHRVLLTGGTGDAYYANFVKWMSQIQLTPDPQLSVARGLCKNATFLSLASEIN